MVDAARYVKGFSGPEDEGKVGREAGRGEGIIRQVDYSDLLVGRDSGAKAVDGGGFTLEGLRACLHRPKVGCLETRTA